MSKTYIYLTIIVMLVLGLSITGVIDGTTSNLFQGLGLTNNNLDTSTQFSLTNFFDSIFGTTFGILAALFTVGGIVAGFIANRDIASYARASFALGFGTWIIGDLWSMWNVVANLGDGFAWAGYILRALVILLFVGLGYSLVQFATGGD